MAFITGIVYSTLLQASISRKRRRASEYEATGQSRTVHDNGLPVNPENEQIYTKRPQAVYTARSRIRPSLATAQETVTTEISASPVSSENEADVPVPRDASDLSTVTSDGDPPEIPLRIGIASASIPAEPLERVPDNLPHTNANRSIERLVVEALVPRNPDTRQSEFAAVPPNPVSPDITSLSGPVLRASKVPSSRLGRLFHYGGLAASLGYGAASEVLRRSSQYDPIRPQTGSLLMTEANLNRLVSKLSQMRGAALKVGQFMSIQDTHVLPEELERVFRRVQDGAHYMPNWQMEKVMRTALGPSWRSHFSSFTLIPSHSASIGQVHLGVLAASSSQTGKEEEVAIKIQFPDIARSISSDLGYLKLLLGASALLPKGLFLDSTIKVFKEELADECNYRREADYICKYRRLDAIHSDSRYKVPWVWDGSTENVLVMECMKGVSVGGDVVHTLSQDDRNEIASRIVELCLRELFEFRMMQTDPNWTNFLWNKDIRQIELIDFGATRDYSSEFTDNWRGLLTAAINKDREACIEWSHKLKYFIGGENEVMTNAHLTSMELLGTPFRDSTPQPYSFAKGSDWTRITEEIRAQIPIMLDNRLTPPPRETYSLNRKLSGAFLLAGRLGASVDCRHLWEKVVDQNAV